MKLLWTPGAVRDLARLRRFLQPKSPGAAARAAARIRQAAAALREQPELGRPVEGAPEVRDLVAPFGAGAFVLRYRVYRDAVVVARVWHGREDQS